MNIPSILQAALAPCAVSVALLGMGLSATPAPWDTCTMQQDDATAACYQAPLGKPTVPTTMALGCVTPDQWKLLHGNAFPVTVVMNTGGTYTRVSVKQAWAMAESGSWTTLFCTR